MNFEIAKVIQRVIDEVTEAKASGMPVELPNYVRFDALVVDDDDSHCSVNIEFDIPILRMMQYGGTMVDYSFSYGAKN